MRLGLAAEKTTCHCAAQYFKTKNLTTRGYQMLDINKIYNTNSSGKLRVIKYLNATNVFVEFLETGYMTKAEANDVKKGNIKDHFIPTVYGVGYFGSGHHISSVNGKTTKTYQAWFNMILRCYCPYELNKSPSYINVNVCTLWHNFQNFATWYENNHKNGHQIDKDIKQRGILNKVYSPETCVFVTQRKNAIEAQAKHYMMNCPNGILHEIYDMKEFCRGTDLDNRGMSAVHTGKRQTYKGWSKV